MSKFPPVGVCSTQFLITFTKASVDQFISPIYVISSSPLILILIFLSSIKIRLGCIALVINSFLHLLFLY